MHDMVFGRWKQAKGCRQPEQKTRKPYSGRRKTGDNDERREACLTCTKTSCKGWCEVMKKL